MADGRGRWLAVVAAFGVLAGSAGAKQAAGGKTSFAVAVSPQTVTVDTVYTPTQASIATIRLGGDDTVAYDERPGFPRLPYVIRLVALPAGAKNVQVTVTPGGAADLGTAPMVEWAQIAQAGGNPPDDIADAPTHWPAPDSQPIDASVKDAQRWPADDGGLVGVDETPTYRVARVRVNPVHWIPASGAITLATSTDVRVEWSGGRTPKLTKRYADWAATELLRHVAVNPDVVARLDSPELRRTDWPYVILTDDFKWLANPIRHNGALPGMVAEFQRLADWRSARGLRARVVRIDDVARGVYGDFKTGAADTQEMLRRFLRWANRHWSTYWVLLGGDTGMIPPRYAVGFGGNCASTIWHDAKPKPDAGRGYWDTATSTLRIRHNAVITPTTVLTSMNTGLAFARVTAPSATNPGWAYAVDDTYATESSAQTNYVMVRGAAADVTYATIVAVLNENSIPADLYYSALLPSAGPGPDWDTNGNGIYGQSGFGGSFDGVGAWPVVMVGRAPVLTTGEAKAFVDKTIAYERYSGIPAGFARKALLTSTNWGGGPEVTKSADAILGDGEYTHTAAATAAQLQFAGAPGGPVYSWRLVTRDAGGGSTPIPYSLIPFPGSLNFLWCSDASCAAPSINIDLFGGSLLAPLPTRHVLVSGPSVDLEPPAYQFDQVGPDGGVTEKEVVRGLFATDLPWLDPPQRLYEDLLDAPGYPSADLAPITEPAVHAQLSTGYNVVSGSGHGWWGGCCGLDYSTVSTLTNGNAGGLIYADSCLTAQFDVDRCVGERMVLAPGGGAVAYIGHSRYVWLGTGPIFERSFWRQLPWSPRIGQALAIARLLHTSDQYQRWGDAALTLFGDPALSLWRGDPPPIVIDVGTKFGARAALDVAVTQPPPGAVATLTANGKLIASKPVDANGHAVFKTKAKPGTTLQVVVGADDFVPAVQSIEVPPKH